MATESFNERQKAFLAYPRYGIVSTINADGSPQATIVWFMRDGDDLVFTVEAESLKSRNMRRDPRIVMAIADGGRFVSAKGSVELDERPEATSLTRSTRNPQLRYGSKSKRCYRLASKSV